MPDIRPTFRVRETPGETSFEKIEQGIRNNGTIGIEFGFYSTARYPPVTTGQDGGKPQQPHPVSTVAAWNEFGTVRSPERPFFRITLNNLRADHAFRRLLGKTFEIRTGRVDPSKLELVGLYAVSALQREIVELREPPNSPVTVEAKGSSNPLIDTGFMRLSATYKVVRG